MGPWSRTSRAPQLILALALLGPATRAGDPVEEFYDKTVGGIHAELTSAGEVATGTLHDTQLLALEGPCCGTSPSTSRVVTRSCSGWRWTPPTT